MQSILEQLDDKKILHQNITNDIKNEYDYLKKLRDKKKVMEYIIINELSLTMQKILYDRVKNKQLMPTHVFIYNKKSSFFNVYKCSFNTLNDLINYKKQKCNICLDKNYFISCCTCKFKICNVCWRELIKQPLLKCPKCRNKIEV